jgi:hypothetical protein
LKCFMITWCSTPTYASIIHLCIIHSKPTMSQVAMNHKLSYQSSNLSCKPSYFSLCNQLCIISKNVSGHYVNRQLGKVPWWLGCMNVHGLSFFWVKLLFFWQTFLFFWLNLYLLAKLLCFKTKLLYYLPKFWQLNKFF